MIQEKAVDRPVTTFDEDFGETIDVQPFDSSLASELTIHELDIGVWMLREKIVCLVIQAFVEVVAILVVELADF